MQDYRVQSLAQALRVFTRHASPFLLIMIIVSFVALRFGTDHSFSTFELSIAGAVALYWPFQEWWMHRFLLHLPPIPWRGQSYEMNFARVHRLHHADPKDFKLIFLPLTAILAALIAFTAFFYLLSGNQAYTYTWMATATTSTLLYEWVHFLTHTDYRPKGKYYRKIWRLHRLHHYKNEHYWYSFTVPWVDQWLGTGPQPKEVPHSSTAQQLNGISEQGND